MNETLTPTGHEACGAQTRAGHVCKNRAGQGTDHPGHGRCKFHGGSTSSGRKNGKREQAKSAVVTYGLPVDVEPHQALLDELHRTAGHVAWLGALIQDGELPADYNPKGKRRDVRLSQTVFGGGEIPSVWLQLYAAERKHLTDVAKTCIQVGIEERRVQLAEQEGQLIAQVLRGVLTELGVMDRPEVPAVVRRHLTMVAGTDA